MVDAIQHKALRIALRALNCTPGALLEEEAGMLPLDLRRKQQSLNSGPGLSLGMAQTL
ncbi:hypothetical protein DPMN_102743 [Dreissena polymorpha]|uniref:Uncharacterized protein n=1 Tax=Dreissena polymorpha TaxID=45954 RepID=A0A9D4RAT2_DREPO|nr:hypothetical protein DPMN_102743 [Dreissena polymorpha]